MRPQVNDLYQRINRILREQVPSVDHTPTQLHKAMSYTVLNGGKRIRALLVYATGIALNCPLERLDPIACAVELIHTYSLVHDDLPAMDDDELRRGKPTCHIAFDEATAILCGDALHSLALEILSSPSGITPETQLKLIHLLVKAIGSQGMAGGQMIDLQSENAQLSEKEIEHMYALKTGALIECCVEMAALANENTQPREFDALTQFATKIGLAFQIQDDIIDIESSTAVLGKNRAQDMIRNKPTYPLQLDMDYSKQRVKALFDEASAALSIFNDEADLLRELSSYIINRNN